MKTKLYRIEIKDAGERETVYWRGVDAHHAAERFTEEMVETGGMEGIEILSVTREKSERVA